MAEHGDGAIIIDTKLDNSGFRKGSAEMKKAMNSLTDTAKELTATVTDAVREMGKATSGAAAETEKASATSTRTLSEVRAELEKTRRKWDELFARQEKALALGDDTDSRGFRALDYDIEQVGERIRVLEEEETRLAAAEAAADAQRVAGIGSLADSAAEASRYADALSEIERATVRETRGMRVWSALKGSVTGALTGIRDGAVRAAQGFATLGKSSQKAQKKLNVKRILMYSLGIRSMYSLVRKAKQYFSEGFGNLAKYSAPVKSAMASVNGALATLKGSLATAFAPIYTAVAPALTYLINLLAQAANYVGQLFAALTGQTSYMKAVSTGISNIGSAAGSAAGSAKKLRRELAGFDELNVLSDNSGGGGGGGGSGAGYKFEENPISQAVIGFSDAIKTALEDQFSKIGLIIAGGAAVIGAILTFSGINVPLGIAMMVSGLSAGFAIVAQHWDSMPDELKRIVTIIEGVLGVALLSIGAILTFSGSNIPLGIALMAAGAVTLASAVAVNWNTIKEKLQGPIGAAVALVSGALLVLGILALMGGLVPLGIGLIVSGAAGLAATIAANWNNLVDLGKTAIKKVKEGWDYLKDKAFEIAVFIGTKISDLWDWTKTQWNNLKERTVSFVATVANNAAQWWINVSGWWDQNIRGKSLSEIVTNVRNSAAQWWGNVQKWWSNTTAGKFVSEFTTGVKNGAAIWWKNVTSWWDSAKARGGGMVSTFVTNVKNGAASWWKNVTTWWDSAKARAGGMVSTFVTNVKNGAASWWKNVTTWWDGAKARAGGMVSTFVTNVKNGAASWWKNVQGWWDGAKSRGGGMVSTFVTNVTNGARAWWDNVKNWWNSAKRGDGGMVSRIYTAVVNNASTWWSQVQSWWNSVKRGDGGMVSKIYTSIVNTASSWWSQVKSWWNSAKRGDGSMVSRFYTSVVDNAKTWWKNVTMWWNKVSADESVPVNARLSTTAANIWNDFVEQWNSFKHDLWATLNINLPTVTVEWRDVYGLSIPYLSVNWDGGKKTTQPIVTKQYSSPIGPGLIDGGYKNIIGRAVGGIIPDGLRGMVKNIPQYARGTLAAHGTMFVAGENGPEIMGHINGKTEILNRSQIAAAMYAATTRALHNVQYRAPAMASGSVLPYAVAAQYARETERLQSTIEASNEDMTQAVISAISSAALAIVGAVQKYSGGSTGSGGPSAQNIIDEINRRTNMFNRSPLKG